jgi:hypothetical protein
MPRSLFLILEPFPPALHPSNPPPLFLLQHWESGRESLGAFEIIVEHFERLEREEGREGGREGIPPRFLDGCQGDVVEARRRWDITRAWREEWEVGRAGGRAGGGAGKR